MGLFRSLVETPRVTPNTLAGGHRLTRGAVSARVGEWAMAHPNVAHLVEDPDSSPGVYSRAMGALVRLAARVAAVDSTVLIVGESGVGKERLARFIHNASPRASGPFVPVNCGALPEALFESELFGHARGAFTGAIHDRPGLFEAADKGTLLLDEVGEVPLPLQVKLLRALQEHEIRRVGENRQRKFNARVIAATNRNLAHDVKERRFRKDLFYRLNVVELSIPPLRERPEDLRGLADTMLARVAAQMKRPITGYSPEALEHILRYPWPGNIRELENVVERACAIATGTLVELAGLPDEVRHHQSLVITSEHVRPLREIERDYILAALERNHGNRTLTAQQLKIGPATLFRKLREYADGHWGLVFLAELARRTLELAGTV
jgi:two-component system, NtrC family, response regulator HydG